MLYGVQFTWLDMLWVCAAVAGILVFGVITNFKWISRSVFVTFLLLKLAFGVGFSIWAIWANVEFDAANYFREGQIYRELLSELLTGQSTEFLHATPFWSTKGLSTDRLYSLTGLLLVLTGESFLGATILAAAFGAMGQLLLYRFLRERVPQIREIYFVPVLLHPSLMLWSGMLMKDSFGIFGLGLSVYYLGKLFSNVRLRYLLPLFIGFYVIILFRAFVLLPLAGFSLFLLWDRVIAPASLKSSGGFILRGLYLLMAGTITLSVIILLMRRVGGNLVEERNETAIIYSQIEAGSTFTNADFSLSLGGIGSLSIGAANGLFRPFPWDVRKPIQAAAMVENLLVLGFVIAGSLAFFRKVTPIQRQAYSSVFLGMLGVSIVIAAGVGMFVNNSGAISRYRIPMIPFLVAAPGLAFGLVDLARRRKPVHQAVRIVLRPTTNR